MEYRDRVKKILNVWANEAGLIGEDYLKINVSGINTLSINAHELNNLITLIGQGRLSDVQVLKSMAITCARLAESIETMEREQKEKAALEKEKEEAQKAKTAKREKAKTTA